MELKEVFKEDQIIINLEATTIEQTIKKMTEVLIEKKIISDSKEFIESVLSREEHSTTGIGNRIAIPHGKSNTVLTPAIVYAKLSNPVEWQSLDDNPVENVILLAIPNSEKGATHLKLLSGIAMKLMDDELVERLKNETDKSEIIKLFNK